MTQKIPTPIAIGIILILAAGISVFILYGQKDDFKVNNTSIKIPSIVGIPDKIIILSPKPNEEITSPVLMRGKARGFWFFEASFPVKIYDANENLLGQWYASFVPDFSHDSWMTTDFINFESKIEFKKPLTDTGYIVFEKDNPSGLRELDESYKMPVKFKEISAATRKIKLYYYNLEKDKEIADYIPCSSEAVLPVDRDISLTKTPVQDVIKLLLEGRLKDDEKNKGFSTEFPLEGFKLMEVNLKDRILTLKFDDPENKSSGGSCRVGLLWSQIEKTAKQFSEVKEVKFLPETLFQP